MLYVERQQRQFAQLLLYMHFELFVTTGQQDNLLLMQILLLHQPGTENNRNQPDLFFGKLHVVFRFKAVNRLAGSSNQPGIKSAELLR